MNLLGEFTGLPFRYTWPEFPTGMVSRVQVEGSLQVFATAPWYFTLGDPRIAMNANPPYSPQERDPHGWRCGHSNTRARRRALCRCASRAESPGLSLTCRGWGHCRWRAQLPRSSADGQSERGQVPALRPQGGDFTLRLQRRAPLWWRVLNPLMNALDEGYINSKINDIGSYISCRGDPHLGAAAVAQAAQAGLSGAPCWWGLCRPWPSPSGGRATPGCASTRR